MKKPAPVCNETERGWPSRSRFVSAHTHEGFKLASSSGALRLSQPRSVVVALALVMALFICIMKSMAADLPTSNRVFRAGAAASNITPRIGGSIMGYFNERHSTNIHDELHAR